MAAQSKRNQRTRSAPPTISWKAFEYVFYEKTSDWYWSIGIVAIGLLVTAFLMRNVLFGFIVLIGVFALFLYGSRRPKKVLITISPRGIQIDDHIHPYDMLKSFWIFYEPGGTKELSVIADKPLANALRIPIENANPAEIRNTLVQYLPEKEQEYTFSDAVARLMRL